MTTTIVWFRGRDLRIRDHEALSRAARDGRVVACFVLRREHGDRPTHRLQFLHESLRELDAALEQLGGRLIVVHGPATTALPRLVRQFAADRVACVATVEPAGAKLEARVREALPVPLLSFAGETLLEPGEVLTKAGTMFRVFTPFSRAARERMTVGRPLPRPTDLGPVPEAVPAELCLRDLTSGSPRNPEVLAGGETAARHRLDAFVPGAASGYAASRDQLGTHGTSRLSQDLKFGTLSVRTVWSAIETAVAPGSDRDRFLTQLLWREFALHLLAASPTLLHRPFRAAWDGFPWRNDAREFQAWQRGTTGYPLVDAAARQLLQTGFVHNRARMIAASFLCKHLLVDYRWGEQHYLRWLTDGDLASNNLGWQWSAGCGCDAQPWFRVFNPVTQGRKFDPTGAYVRALVPELAALPARYLHAPWLAPEATLEAAGLRIGDNYPSPIVDHADARQHFLDTARDHLKT